MNVQSLLDMLPTIANMVVTRVLSQLNTTPYSSTTAINSCQLSVPLNPNNAIAENNTSQVVNCNHIADSYGAKQLIKNIQGNSTLESKQCPTPLSEHTNSK